MGEIFLHDRACKAGKRETDFEEDQFFSSEKRGGDNNMKAALIAFVVFASFVGASKADDDEHIRTIVNSAIADMHLPRQVGDFLITHAALEGRTMHVFLDVWSRDEMMRVDLED